MEKSKQIHLGNIEIRTGNDARFYKYGLEAVIRSKNGQGWGLPLVDIEPDDLRNLADLMEEERKEYEENLMAEKVNQKKLDIIELYRNCHTNLKIVSVFKNCDNNQILEFDFNSEVSRMQFMNFSGLDLDFLDNLVKNNYAEIEVNRNLHVAYAVKFK